MFVALMSIEEHQHSLIPEVALSKSVLIYTMNLRISQHVANTLKINNHHVTLSKLPGEVT